jgi:hypothetical protein
MPNFHQNLIEINRFKARILKYCKFCSDFSKTGLNYSASFDIQKICKWPKHFKYKGQVWLIQPTKRPNGNPAQSHT